MVDLITKKRLEGAAPFKVGAFEYDPAAVSVVTIGKEVGGTGATGTAMSIIELLISREIHVIVVDLATTQLDLAIPYAAVPAVTVQEQNDEMSIEATVLRAVANAVPGDVVVVQFPASAIEKIGKLNAFLTYVLAQTEAPVTATIIWTMDADRCSSDTLQVMLDSKLPGALSVHWPSWNGPPELDEAVRRQMTSQGGMVFSMPALPPSYYKPFKRDRVAPATQYAEGDVAIRAELDFWRHMVWQSLGGEQ